MQKIEGYWRIAESDDGNLPWPKINTFIDSHREQFIEKLKALQATTRQDYYRGWSSCRICKQHNGSAEFNDSKWLWPEGLLHYVQDHNVRPSQEFIDYVLSRK